MKRRYTAAPAPARCGQDITLRDGSAAQCMRWAVQDGQCRQHAQMRAAGVPKPDFDASLGEACNGDPVRKPAAGVPESRAVKVHAYGGNTGINDYLMTDGTVKAMRPDEVQWASPGVDVPRDDQRSEGSQSWVGSPLDRDLEAIEIALTWVPLDRRPREAVKRVRAAVIAAHATGISASDEQAAR